MPEDESAASGLSGLKTRWDIANQPVDTTMLMISRIDELMQPEESY